MEGKTICRFRKDESRAVLGASDPQSRQTADLSALSKRLNPPVKWSYRKLIRWWVVVFLSVGWIVFYIDTGVKNSAAVLAPPLTKFSKFLEVQVAEPIPSVPADSRIGVRLRNGRSLVVGRGCDAEQVRTLLAVVESAG